MSTVILGLAVLDIAFRRTVGLPVNHGRALRDIFPLVIHFRERSFCPIVIRRNFCIWRRSFSVLRKRFHHKRSAPAEDKHRLAALGKLATDFLVQNRFFNKDAYGADAYDVQFIRNVFVKTDNRRSDYRTIRCGYWRGTDYASFVDCKFENGAKIDSVGFGGYAGYRREIIVQWTLELIVKDDKGNPLEDAEVEIIDIESAWAEDAFKSVFKGKTSPEGKVSTALTEYVQTPEGKVASPPYVITVRKQGYESASKEIRINSPKKLEISLKK